MVLSRISIAGRDTSKSLATSLFNSSNSVLTGYSGMSSLAA